MRRNARPSDNDNYFMPEKCVIGCDWLRTGHFIAVSFAFTAAKKKKHRRVFVSF